MKAEISKSALNKLDAAEFDYRSSVVKARLTRWLDACDVADSPVGIRTARYGIALRHAAAAIFQIGMERVTPLMGRDYAAALLQRIFQEASISGLARSAIKAWLGESAV